MLVTCFKPETSHERGIRETLLHADTVSSWAIRNTVVVWTPSDEHRVYCDHERSESVRLGASEERLRELDRVRPVTGSGGGVSFGQEERGMDRPIELIPAMPIRSLSFRNLFHGPRRGRTDDQGYANLCCRTRRPELAIAVHQAVCANWSDENRRRVRHTKNRRLWRCIYEKTIARQHTLGTDTSR